MAALSHAGAFCCGEREEGFDDALWELAAIAFGQQLMACAGDGEKFCAPWDELHRRLQLIECGEAVARTVNKEAGRAKLREVRGAQVLRTLRRMERIGEQQEAINETGFSRGQH